MFRKLLFVLVVLLIIATVREASAYQGYSPQHGDSAWQVSFWNNTTLSGNPVLTGTQSQIDFNWGVGSPDAAVQTDYFSARWQRYFDLAGGNYEFKASSDDGIRVWVDDQLVIDDWTDHALRNYSAGRMLSAGHHKVVVEYYEGKGLAEIHLDITPKDVPFNNWRGEYFANQNLSGSPSLVRDDAAVYFNWFDKSPGPGIPADHFSVRWSRSLSFPPGSYRFNTAADDGVRLWVDGHLLIDSWKDQAATDYTATIYLEGSVFITLEYYENGGMAVTQLTWSPANSGRPIDSPPSSKAIIVDDHDAGFVMGGSPTAWRYVYEGFNGDLTWTWNNDQPRTNYNWARWYPSLQAGRYEVYVYVPDRYTTTTSARYWVVHRDGYTSRLVNQSTDGGRWVSLGIYNFQGTSSDYVSLSDVTYEPYVTRLIAFDAVRWEPR